MRNLLILLVLLLWAALGWKMCTDYQACCGPEIGVVVPPPVKEQPRDCSGVICFDRHDCDPNFCSSWATYRDSIINAIGDNQKLVITGFYGTGERNESAFDNLGLCRADGIRQGLLDFLGSKVVEIAGQLRVGGGTGNDGYSCERASFRIVDMAEEISSKSLIYFPYNSTSKLQDASVEAYLRQVATRVKSSGERVRLTGHTDSRGRETYNMSLGRNRAIIVRDYLIANGVSSSKIIIDSKGESQPVATNDTDDGRAKNRRTELEII